MIHKLRIGNFMTYLGDWKISRPQQNIYLAMKTILRIYVKLWVTFLVRDISTWKQAWPIMISKLVATKHSSIIDASRDQQEFNKVRLLYVLVNSGWAIAWFWPGIQGKIYSFGYCRIPQAEMRRLIMLMVCIAPAAKEMMDGEIQIEKIFW